MKYVSRLFIFLIGKLYFAGKHCGLGEKNKTQSFQNLFSGDIFLYLLNIFATAAPKLKQKLSKIIFQF